MEPQVALVTGAGKRIGRDIALALAKAGYAVAVHFHNSGDAARDLARRIVGEGGRAAALEGDLEDWGVGEALIARVQSSLGSPALLVNNAALFLPDSAGALDAETWRRQFAVNLQAPVLLAGRFAAELPEGMRGAVVNVIDQRVLRLTPQNFSYTLAKAALWTATQTLAQALAPRVRVNAVGPGPTYPSWREGEAGLNIESANVPLQRRIAGDEIAQAVLYLARAESVTGTMLCVDGGQHLAWRTPDIVG